MKGKTFAIGTVASALLAVATLLPGLARAEYVQAQTPFMAGLSSPTMFSMSSAHSGGSHSLFDQPSVVWGTSLRIDSLSLSGAGTLTLQLSDLEFPTPLESLSLLVTDLHGLWQRLDGPGSLLVDLDGPAKLFVAVFARTDDRHIPGLYAVTTNFAPVPLPAAAWLLLSGLGGLAAFRRKRRH